MLASIDSESSYKLFSMISGIVALEGNYFQFETILSELFLFSTGGTTFFLGYVTEFFKFS